MLGISNAVGTGIAVLTVINLAAIGRTALCKMTSPDELARYFG
jgi:hypothetical protein